MSTVEISYGERIQAGVRELQEFADYLDDPVLALTDEQKIALVKRLLQVSAVLVP